MEPATLVASVKRYNELVPQARTMISASLRSSWSLSRRPRLWHLSHGACVRHLLRHAGQRRPSGPGRRRQAIKGLYVVGNLGGGFYGGVDYPLTVYGLSLGRCYTFGYLAGRHVAKL